MSLSCFGLKFAHLIKHTPLRLQLVSESVSDVCAEGALAALAAVPIGAVIGAVIGTVRYYA